MDSMKYLLYKSLKEQFNFSFEDYTTNEDKRTLFQIYSFFINEVLRLGYGKFNLYLNGPFNNKLASLGLEISFNKDYFEKQVDQLYIDENSINKLNEVNKIINDEIIPNGLELLSIFAIYYYFKSRTQNNDDDIFYKINNFFIESSNNDFIIEYYHKLSAIISPQIKVSEPIPV